MGVNETNVASSRPCDFSECLDGILAHGRGVLSMLTALESDPAPFDVAYKDGLLNMIARIESFSSSLETAVDTLDNSQAKLWLAAVDRVLRVWADVNEAVDRAVALAIKGSLEKRFFFLSPIANCANLSERMRLKRLYRRLAERLVCFDIGDKTRLDSAAVADPDLLGMPAVVDAVGPKAVTVPVASKIAMVPAVVREPKGFADCLLRVGGEDDLDRAEALIDVVRRYPHHLLARMLNDHDAGDVELTDCLGVIARHAELVFLEDYHFSARRMKLSHLLAASTAFATGGFFRGLLTLFHENGTSQPDGSFPSVPIGETLDLRETILRTMLFHPAQSYRSFATGELAPSKFWSVTSYPHVPVAALREISERLAADDMTDDYRRVFFDCTFARLMDVHDEAEVRFAREVINRYFTFDFFLEDNYFTKLQTLNQSVEKHEKRFGIDDAFFKRSVAAFLDEKERAGSKKTKLPKSFVEIPLTVQRKLAREGHYLSLFIRHPHAKIALETVRFLDTSAKIEKVLRVRTTNRHVVRAIAKKDDLMSAYPTRLALVNHPHTPVEISLKHLPGIRAGDMRRLAASRDISPELGANLRKRFGARQRSSA